MKAKLDYLFLGILGVALLSTAYITFNSDYVLTNYHYAAIVCWVVALLLRLFKPRMGRYAVGSLLIFGTLNILNFLLTRTGSYFALGDLTILGFDPYLFCILVVYYLINKKPINRIVKNLFRGSEKEQVDKHQKMVNFYLKQFEDSTPAELEMAFSNINDYPIEAQAALGKIRNERGIVRFPPIGRV